jgi:hypothetical protein
MVSRFPQNGFVRAVFQPFFAGFWTGLPQVSLTKAGLAAHDTIVAGGQERNRRLLAELSETEIENVARPHRSADGKAARMLADEKDST